MTDNTVAIVDAFSSGALLAPEFHRRGVDCVMVQSLPRVPTIYERSFRPTDFVEIIPFRGVLQDTAARLQALGVGHVLAGCELGVTLADRLSECLGLPSNGSRLSAARRNKILMAQAVSQRGLRTPAQVSSSNVEDLLAWVRRRGCWPVVLKPVSSAGNDGVCACFTMRDVEQAFFQVINQWNTLGGLNGAVMAQEFLAGTEYVVDTVSCAGRHQVAAFWKYGKPSSDPYYVGYDCMELLPCEEVIQRKLFEYVAQVLDALEIRYGPAHCEVMWVEGEPVLMEVGARMNGGNSPLISQLCSDRSQVQLTAESYLDPERFLGQLGQPYALRSNATLAFLTPCQQRLLADVPGEGELKNLASLQDSYVGKPSPHGTPRILGWVVLLHPDKAVVDAELRQLRALENNGLYAYAA